MSAEYQRQSDASGVVIHRISKGDLPRLELIVAGMGASKDGGYFERQMAYQEAGTRAVFIIRTRHGDAGYGILNWDPKYTFFRKMDIPEVQDINVLPHYRRQGLAQSLIAHCEDLARQADKTHIGIGVSVSARFGPAQRLYAKLGYVPDGYGVTHDRKPAGHGSLKPVDDQLCLMMVKGL